MKRDVRRSKGCSFRNSFFSVAYVSVPLSVDPSLTPSLSYTKVPLFLHCNLFFFIYFTLPLLFISLIPMSVMSSIVCFHIIISSFVIVFNKSYSWFTDMRPAENGPGRNQPWHVLIVLIRLHKTWTNRASS